MTLPLLRAVACGAGVLLGLVSVGVAGSVDPPRGAVVEAPASGSVVGAPASGSVVVAPAGPVAAGGAEAVVAGAVAAGAVVRGTAVRGSASDAAAPWVWPTGSRVVGRPWEAPADDYAPGHRGIDVPAALGMPAVAVADGRVSFAGPVGGRPVVSIDHGGGLVSTLDSVTPTVSAGEEVSQGATVGRVAVGHCPATDPCVHLGARLDGRYVDPVPYLPAAAWPVLLPESAWPG